MKISRVAIKEDRYGSKAAYTTLLQTCHHFLLAPSIAINILRFLFIHELRRIFPAFFYVHLCIFSLRFGKFIMEIIKHAKIIINHGYSNLDFDYSYFSSTCALFNVILVF